MKMKTVLILFSTVFAAGSASFVPVVPLAYVLEPVPTYNRVDNTLTGEYAYSYGGGPSSRVETKSSDGVTRGAYNYIDGSGLVQSAHYVADKDGFRVLATNIPTDAKIGVNVPLETPEVQAAKAAHFAEHAKAVAALGRKKRSVVIPASAISTQYHNIEKETLRIEADPVNGEGYQGYLNVPVHAYVTSYQPSLVATGVSHQSRSQTHKSSRIEVPVSASSDHPGFVELLESPAVAVLPDQIISYQVAEPLLHQVEINAPLAVSSQSRYQVHNAGDKIKLEETPSSSVVSVPVAATAGDADAVIVDAFRAAVPTAVSSQSRSQIHSGSRLEFAASPLAVDSYGHPAVAVSSYDFSAAPLAYAGSSHLVAQIPVDSPEVAAAKREHAKAYAAELAKHQGW